MGLNTQRDPGFLRVNAGLCVRLEVQSYKMEIDQLYLNYWYSIISVLCSIRTTLKYIFFFDKSYL